MLTANPNRQTFTIQSWHPIMSANGSHGHWATHQKQHDIDRDMAWASAMQAGWHFMHGRVRLTITLVYPRKYRLDSDNAVSKCKGLVDGLRNGHEVRSLPRVGVKLETPFRRKGWFTDDSTDWLELIVRTEVVPGVRETRLCLEPILEDGSTA